ncbi:hypothetical protein HMPREF0290_1114 [Corynebacterium efficiens YS-314]|uniref:Uncharacterized protein n=1 Tax=Corynebacterium efficiens (strain DSM 44549 / YS-314 / AJ 12310 / JCM 11189 / NBRC 100395) TaxID=196164 RepID=Q8FRZ2_COREF|nr:imm68 putative immunity domain-containing protein [Corynebacterium efficiens]EEW50264.1 hypothetical protein HMPREF0290_1114 [Corynebacterium efficiens YS-314]BAC17426.1 hypothetical protein [Corynebacterium efficiens YS-314]
MSDLNNVFGTSDEATALLKHLQQRSGETVDVTDVFTELGLDKLSGNYTDTQVEGYGDAFMVVAALAALIVGEGEVTLHVDAKEKTQISTALKYFALSPEEHAVAERFDEDDLYEVADLAEELRGQLD